MIVSRSTFVKMLTRLRTLEDRHDKNELLAEDIHVLMNTLHDLIMDEKIARRTKRKGNKVFLSMIFKGLDVAKELLNCMGDDDW